MDWGRWRSLKVSLRDYCFWLYVGAARAVEQCEETSCIDEAGSGSTSGQWSQHHSQKAGHIWCETAWISWEVPKDCTICFWFKWHLHQNWWGAFHFANIGLSVTMFSWGILNFYMIVVRLKLLSDLWVHKNQGAPKGFLSYIGQICSEVVAWPLG